MDQHPEPTDQPTDAAEQALTHAHVIVPMVGAVLIFIMALIAILFGAPNGS